MEPIIKTEELVSYLEAALSGNNQLIQGATKSIKTISKNKACLPSFLEIISGHPKPEIKQMAAVLVNKKIINLLKQLSVEEQNFLKARLLELYFSEQSPIVYKAIANLCGTAAALYIEENKWPEVFVVIGQNSQAAKEKSLILLGSVIENSGSNMSKFYDDFFEFFKICSADQNHNVKKETVKCLIHLFEEASSMSKEQVKKYKELVPQILMILDKCIDEVDEEMAFLCYEAFIDLVQYNNKALISEFLGQIILFSCSEKVLLNEDFSANFKECVIDFICTISECERAVITKQPDLLKKVIEVACFLVSKKATQEEIDEGETLNDVAIWLLETFANTLPAKKFFKLIYENIQALLSSGQDSHIVGAFAILGSISEGTAEQMKKVLEEDIVKKYLINAFNHSSAEVRGAAIKCISYLAEYLQPDILDFHVFLLPPLVKSFQDPNKNVVEKALFAIDIFCENLEKETLQPYLQTLIPQLGMVLINGASTITMKKYSVSAIGTCASTAEEQFTPYLDEFCKVLSELVHIQNTPEISSLKAEAITSLGKVANVFAKGETGPSFLSYLNPLISHILSILQFNDDYELRESCLAFFYLLADSIKNQFAPYLNAVTEVAFKVIENTDGMTNLNNEKDDEEEEFEEEDDECGDDKTNIKLGFFDEKAAAIHAIGDFASSCPLEFEPYYLKTISMLEEFYQHFYENIRIQTIVTYQKITEAYCKKSNGGVFPEFKRGIPVEKRLDPQLEEFINTDLITRYFYIIENDDSNEAVASAIECLIDLINSIGPAFIDKNIPQVVKLIELMLKCETNCQKYQDDGEEDETNVYVYDNVTDLIPCLSKALKNGFTESFRALAPLMGGYLSREKEITDQTKMIGCFAQCFKHTPALISECQNNILQSFANFWELDDDDYNRNAAYCIAVMCQKSPATMEPLYENILAALKKIIDISEKQESKDNAVTAILKMVMASPSKMKPDVYMNDILTCLPFKGDKQENKSGLKFIVFLIQNFPQLLQNQAFAEKSVSVLIDGIANSNDYLLGDKFIASLSEFIKTLAASNPDLGNKFLVLLYLIQTFVATLSEAQRTTCQKYLN